MTRIFATAVLAAMVLVANGATRPVPSKALAARPTP